MFPSSRPFQYTSMKLGIRIPSTYLFHHAYPSDAITKRFNVICHMHTVYQFHHAAPARATPRHSNDLQCHTFQPCPAPSNLSPDLQFLFQMHTHRRCDSGHMWAQHSDQRFLYFVVCSCQGRAVQERRCLPEAQSQTKEGHKACAVCVKPSTSVPHQGC